MTPDRAAPSARGALLCADQAAQDSTGAIDSMKDQPKDNKAKAAGLYALVATSIVVLAVYTATLGWL